MKLIAPPATSPSVAMVMRGNRKSGTKPELRLRSHLHRRGSRFRVNLTIEVPGLKVRPDVVFPRIGLAVMVDGCFWHGCPIHGSLPSSNSDYWRAKLSRNLERDRRVDSALQGAGWSVLRIWEHLTIEDAVALVEAAYGEGLPELMFDDNLAEI